MRLTNGDRHVTFGYRTEDARLEATGGLPEGARIVADPMQGLAQGLVEGKAVRVSDGGKP